MVAQRVEVVSRAIVGANSGGAESGQKMAAQKVTEPGKSKDANQVGESKRQEFVDLYLASALGLFVVLALGWVSVAATSDWGCSVQEKLRARVPANWAIPLALLECRAKFPAGSGDSAPEYQQKPHQSAVDSVSRAPASCEFPHPGAMLDSGLRAEVRLSRRIPEFCGQSLRAGRSRSNPLP
jgi:hypothetical protein